ncbi:DUF2292 domain-containing protein [Neobacillus pocheonensis]
MSLSPKYGSLVITVHVGHITQYDSTVKKIW